MHWRSIQECNCTNRKKFMPEGQKRCLQLLVDKTSDCPRIRRLHSFSPATSCVTSGPEIATLPIFPITVLPSLLPSTTCGEHKNISQHYKHNQGFSTPGQSFCCYSQHYWAGPVSAVTPSPHPQWPPTNRHWHM